MAKDYDVKFHLNTYKEIKKELGKLALDAGLSLTEFINQELKKVVDANGKGKN